MFQFDIKTIFVNDKYTEFCEEIYVNMLKLNDRTELMLVTSNRTKHLHSLST